MSERFMAPPPPSPAAPRTPHILAVVIPSRPGAATEISRASLAAQRDVAVTLVPPAAEAEEAEARWREALAQAPNLTPPPDYLLRLPSHLRLAHDRALAGMAFEAARRPGDVWVFAALDWAAQCPAPALRLERFPTNSDKIDPIRTIQVPARLGLAGAAVEEPTPLECWRRGRALAAEILAATKPQRRAQAGAVLTATWSAWRRLGDARRLHLLLGAQSLLAAGLDAGGEERDPALERLFQEQLLGLPEARLAETLRPFWDDPLRLTAQIMNDEPLGL